MFAELPLYQVLTVMLYGIDQENRQGLWRSYMANLIPMLGGRDAKTFAEVMETYERMTKKTDYEEERRQAHDAAESTIRALERARGGA